MIQNMNIITISRKAGFTSVAVVEVILFAALVAALAYLIQRGDMEPPTPPQTAAACTADADCKILYSNCSCEAVPITDPRTEIKSDIVCIQNSCRNEAQIATAVCENQACTVRIRPVQALRAF